MVSDVAKNKRRLALCKTPLFPGSPSEYTYHPERCILVRNGHKKQTKTKSTERRAQRAIDRVELSALGAITGAWVQQPMKLPIDPSIAGETMRALEDKDAAIIRVFRRMISHPLRSKFPDPVKRMVHLQRPDKELGPKMKLIVRYRVFLLMEAHLTEVMAMTA